MKLKKFFAAIFSCVMALSMCLTSRTDLLNIPTSTGASVVESYGDLYYIAYDSYVEIVGCNSSYAEISAVPKWIKGLPVTSIGDYAFKSCRGLTKMTIPNSVTNIGREAFYDCYNLVSITIPDSVKSIGLYAFSRCTSLKSIEIPEGITSIGDDAFKMCSSLTSVTIPDSVTSIERRAFEGCSSLKTIKIPDSVKSINNGAFSDCSSLNSVTMPDSLTSLGNAVFQGCSSLTTVKIPDSVTIIRMGLFSGCSNLSLIKIPNSVTSIEEYAFYGCDKIKRIIIPSNVTEIGEKGLGYTLTSEKIDTFKIYGHSGTEAEEYALKNNFIFIDMDNPPKLNCYTLSLNIGETYDLEVMNYTGNDITWKSNDTSVAEVKNGCVNAVSEGATLIVAAFAGETLECNVVVNSATTAASTTTTTTTTSQTTTSTTATTPTKPVQPIKSEAGDVNSDGTIDAFDASMILIEYSMKATGRDSIFNDGQSKAADLNADGAVDALDASMVLIYYAYKATGGTESIEKFLSKVG